MSALPGVLESLVVVYLGLGMYPPEGMPRLSRDGEIVVLNCGPDTGRSCDYDDGTPECELDQLRGKRCVYNAGRLDRHWLMTKKPREGRTYKLLFAPEFMRELHDGGWQWRVRL
jgi:hypothetical protein